MVIWSEAIGKRNIIGSRSTMDDEWNFNEADYWVKTKYADEVWKIYFSGEKLHSPGNYFGQ